MCKHWICAEKANYVALCAGASVYLRRQMTRPIRPNDLRFSFVREFIFLNFKCRDDIEHLSQRPASNTQKKRRKVKVRRHSEAANEREIQNHFLFIISISLNYVKLIIQNIFRLKSSLLRRGCFSFRAAAERCCDS